MKLISTSLENIWISVALIVFYRVLFHVHAYIIINSRCHYQ